MKVNDLMLGDWVYNRIADITFQVYPQFFSQWHNRPEQFEATIQPIPLTSEILEKNGWRCFNVYHTYDCPKVPLYLRQQKDGGYALEVDNDYGGAVFSVIRYVHQLQCALRLCGIEHEITL